MPSDWMRSSAWCSQPPCSRRRRTIPRPRCTCSVTLARWKYVEKARTRRAVVARSSADSGPSSSPPSARASARTASTRSSSSWPSCRTSVSPSSVVSRRMSARNAEWSSASTTAGGPSSTDRPAVTRPRSRRCLELQRLCALLRLPHRVEEVRVVLLVAISHRREHMGLVHRLACTDRAEPPYADFSRRAQAAVIGLPPRSAQRALLLSGDQRGSGQTPAAVPAPDQEQEQQEE